MNADSILHVLGVLTVASPVVLLLLIGISTLMQLRIDEHLLVRLIQCTVTLGLAGSLGVLALMLLTGQREVAIELGNWIEIPQQSFQFHVKFIFDRLSVPFSILSFVLCGTVGAFAKVYLHREPGFHRFFLFYSVFLLGMIMSSLAGTIETLFFGWELVGLSSALLVAYFQDRPMPVRNGIQVWSIYRIADAAFLVAALTLHHLTGHGDFTALMGEGVWPESVAHIDSRSAFVVGILLLVAASGKSGMVPFSGWLPRAMEGPTPSSAIFYGALSVHLGAYLLLRVSPLFVVSLPLTIMVVLAGLVSAVFGAYAARVQTDVKSALAYASLTQLGIIVIEIGLGLRYLALIHMIGHALLRTLQLLRAPSLLQDYSDLEDAIGDVVRENRPQVSALNRPGPSIAAYRFCHERGYFDSLIQRCLVMPFVRVFRAASAIEDRWIQFLSAGRSPRDPLRHHLVDLTHGGTADGLINEKSTNRTIVAAHRQSGDGDGASVSERMGEAT
jgi:NAD(P)H-quinone oxidoreductase subunit 5